MSAPAASSLLHACAKVRRFPLRSQLFGCKLCREFISPLCFQAHINCCGVLVYSRCDGFPPISYVHQRAFCSRTHQHYERRKESSCDWRHQLSDAERTKNGKEKIGGASVRFRESAVLLLRARYVSALPVGSVQCQRCAPGKQTSTTH